MKHFMMIALLATLFTNMAMAAEVDTDCPLINQTQENLKGTSSGQTKKPASQPSGSGQ